MFENIMKIFKKFNKKEEKEVSHSREAAKERLHLVLMQDRANVSADFLELMKQEIIEVIKKYIDVDERAIDVRLTNKENDDGTNGAPALYANIPIVNIKNEARKVDRKEEEKEKKEKDKEKNNDKENKEKSKESNTKENHEELEESNDKQDKVEEQVYEEEKEDIPEIQNERIAKVILEAGIYNPEDKDKKKKKKSSNKDETEEIEDTKEESKSKN